MKIDILQFIKKLNLAISLAEHDSLFVVSGLKSFALPARLAALFRIPSDVTPAERVSSFLNAEDNPLLYAAFDEITARSDVVGSEILFDENREERIFNGDVVFKTSEKLADDDFFIRLFGEIADVDLPQLKPQLQTFLKRLDLLRDMRFYGAELETFFEYTDGLPGCCSVSVDWAQTDKPRLCLYFPEPVVYTRQLSLAAQENLLNLFASLFFERSVFVSYFDAVAVDENDKVNVMDFDYIYPVDSVLRRFLSEYLGEECEPRGLMEHKLARVIKLLRLYCPAQDVNAVLLGRLEQYPRSQPQNAPVRSGLMDIYSKQGLVLSPRSELTEPNPESLAYLLDKNRFKKDPQFKKSSIFYYLPLLVVIYILLKFF